jgi:hypothetical protein
MTYKKIIRFFRLIFYAYWVIPEGPYCYFGSRNPACKTYKECPYWDSIEGLHHQECGYCHFLGRGDYDKNNDESEIFTNVKTGEKVSAPDMPFGVGLLWDQVKECGIKDE